MDDSAAMRKILSLVFAEAKDLDLVGTAFSGELALQKLAARPPDLVTLDLDMPGLGGLETLTRIREEFPEIKVLVVSALTRRGALSTLDALSRGAADYVTKPSVSSPEEGVLALRREILPRVRTLCAPREPAPPHVQETARRVPTKTWPRVSGGSATVPELVVLAASTGGPPALREVLGGLPPDFPTPILVVQHMPKAFTTHFAERLNDQVDLEVGEAQDGVRPRPGQVWIAPGDRHLLARADVTGLVLELSDDPEVHSCKPAADHLFASAAESCGSRVLGVVLTGMGQDALEGARALRTAGARVLVQDEPSSAVWGMPGHVAKEGLAHEVLPLRALGPRIAELAQGAPSDR